MIDDPRASGDQPSPVNDEESPDESIVGGEPVDLEIPAPKAEDAKDAQEELATTKDQLLRTLAELENTRRRARKEVEDASKYALSGFARDCLSVADNLERALASVPEDALKGDERLTALHEGVAMTGRELASIFERHGIKRIEAEGQRFDPNLHQAMLEVPTNDHPPGTVVQVLQVGYTVKDRLLRPAMVSVAKAAGGNGEGAAGEDDAEAESRGGRLDTSV